MFFILSKTLGLLLKPLIIPYLFLAVGLFARWRRWRWIMRLAILIAITLPLGYGFLPVSSLPLQFLENRIARGDIGQRHTPLALRHVQPPAIDVEGDAEADDGRAQ